MNRIPFLLACALGLILSVQGLVWAAPSPSVDDFAQCANGTGTSTSCPDGWIGGALNSNNSHYVEDDVIPQRTVVDLPAGGATIERTVTFEYTARKGSATAHAYDSLATWNLTQTTAQRCDGLAASQCVGGSANTFPIPDDPTVVCPETSATTPHMIASGSGRVMTMYGGTITGVSVPSHSNANPAGCGGDDDASVTVTFSVPSLPAKVMLLVDPRHSVGSRLTNSGETGVITGRGQDNPRMELLDPTVEVSHGEEVVTSGYDKGIYPPGIPIGRIDKAQEARDGLTQSATVEPFVAFSRLDFVRVLLDSGPLRDLKESPSSRGSGG